MCASHVLILLGGAMQIAGVAWAVFEVGKIRRSLIALRKVGQEIAAEIRSMFKEEKHTTGTIAVEFLASGSTVATPTIVRVEQDSPPTLDERVGQLEAAIRRVDEHAAKDREDLEKRIKRATEHADAIDRELRELIDAQEAQRRESEASAKRLQSRIAPLLVIGLALNVAGSVVPC